MSHSLPLPSWRHLVFGAASFALVSACVVDETGYVDPNVQQPGAGVEGDMDGEAPDRDAAEEPAPFRYASTSALGPAPQLVTVFGLPGAVAGDAAVSVAVLPDGAPVAAAVDADAGSFVAVVSAALGDAVAVREAGAEVGRITLSDALEGAALDAGGSPPTAEQDDLAAPAVIDGRVAVGDGALGVPAPYVALVAATGAVADVAVGDAAASLPASAGDTLCVAPRTEGAAAGQLWCVTL